MTWGNKTEKLLARQTSIKEQIRELQAQEKELRTQILKDSFNFEGDDREGTENIELGNGYKLKGVFKLTRKLDKKETPEVLNAMRSMSPEGAFIADRIVTWEPKLNKKEYDSLNPQFKGMVDSVLTTTAGLPSLSIVEPPKK